MKAQPEFSQIVKDKTADAGKFCYTYASLPAVLAAVLPALNKHEIVLWQSFGDGHLVTNLTHVSGEGIESTLDCSDAGLTPQDFGKKISYYRRYAVLTLLGLAPDDDTDAQGVPAAAERDVPLDPPAEKRSAFDESVRNLFEDGVGALIGHADDPKTEMATRMSRILGNMGFTRASEITSRDRQKEFYHAFEEMVTEIRNEHPSPVA